MIRRHRLIGEPARENRRIDIRVVFNPNFNPKSATTRLRLLSGYGSDLIACILPCVYVLNIWRANLDVFGRVCQDELISHSNWVISRKSDHNHLNFHPFLQLGHNSKQQARESEQEHNEESI